MKKTGALLCAGTALLLISSVAGAQTVDSRWTPWMGCWSAPAAAVAADSGMICVRAAQSGAGVDFETVVNRQVVERQHVNANGERVPVTRDGCPGWESAAWSADGRRVFLRSEFTCASNLLRKSSAVMAFSSQGEWIQVSGVSVNGNTAVHALRYSPSRDGAARTAVIDAPSSETARARASAGARVTPEIVLEVAKNVDSPVAESWLLEVHPEFELKGKDYLNLAHAGMPRRMIDLMAAMANPGTYTIARTPMGEVSGVMRTAENASPAPAYVQYNPFYSDGFGYSAYGPLTSRIGYYGNSVYRNAYSDYSFSRARYNAYGNTYYWGVRPIVIDLVERVPAPPQGRAVYGQGYTRGTGSSVGSGVGSSGPGSGSETSGRTAPSTRTSPTVGGSLGGSGGTSTGRTAHARPPG